MEREKQSKKKVEATLWAVKEAAWEAYRDTPFEPGMLALTKSITRQVNEMLRQIGYDPMVLIR